MLNIINNTITFYEKCSEMPLWNFQQYLETNDLRYFTKEHKSHKDLDNVMTNFYGDYLAKSNNTSVVNRFGTIHKILKLRGKYNIVMQLLKMAYNFPKEGDIEKFNEIIEQLEKWNYRIEKDKNIFDQLEKIAVRVQGIKTQITLLEDEIKKDDNQLKTTIESQLLSVSRFLDIGYLDPKKITVLYWIECQKLAEVEVNNRIKNAKNGK